jgi:hypothetical protein
MYRLQGPFHDAAYPPPTTIDSLRKGRPIATGEYGSDLEKLMT